MKNVKLENSSAATKSAIKEIVGFTPEGNLEAQVNHRKGLLADLLALGTAGDGEIAVATNFDAIVVYNDNAEASVGKAYYNSCEMYSASVNMTSFQSVPTGVAVQKIINIVEAESIVGLIDAVNDRFMVPVGLENAGLAKYVFNVRGIIEVIGGVHVGAEISIQLMRYFNGSLSNYGNAIKGGVLKDGSINLLFDFNYRFNGLDVSNTDYFELHISHDYAGSINFLTGSAVYSIKGYY